MRNHSHTEPVMNTRARFLTLFVLATILVGWRLRLFRLRRNSRPRLRLHHSASPTGSGRTYPTHNLH